MKIAVWHNLPSGGGKRALYAQVQGLLERGHQVEAWCPSTANQEYLPLRELVPEHALPLVLPTRPGYLRPVDRLLWESRQTLARLEAVETHCRRCIVEIERGGFELVLAGPCTLFHTSPMGRLARLPSALYLQEPYRPFFEARPQPFWIAPPTALSSPRRLLSLHHLKARAKDALSIHAARVQLREEVRNASGFSVLLVNSLFSRESMLRAYGLDSRYCPLGVDVDHFAFADGPRKKQLISVGHLYSGKGADRAIKAIACIEPALRPRLLWIGNGSDPDYQAAMGKLARTLEVEFVFRNHVTDDELVTHLQESAAMIYTPRLEPFGYAPLEANSCGTPVVTIAEGGMRETIHNGVNGFIVESENPALLAEALTWLLKDPALCARLGASSRACVEKTWSLAHANGRLEHELLVICTEHRDRSPVQV